MSEDNSLKQRASASPPAASTTGAKAKPTSPLFAHAEDGQQQPKTSKLAPFLAHIKKPKDLKIWLRCSVAAWIATLFIFITPLYTNCKHGCCLCSAAAAQEEIQH